MANSGMNRRREHEAETGLPDAFSDLFRGKDDAHTEAFQDICAAALARHGSIAMLGDSYTCAGCDECRDGGYVEGHRAIAAGSARIQHGSLDWYAQCAGTQGTSEAVNHVGNFALHSKCYEHSAELRRRNLACK